MSCSVVGALRVLSVASRCVLWDVSERETSQMQNMYALNVCECHMFIYMIVKCL